MAVGPQRSQPLGPSVRRAADRTRTRRAASLLLGAILVTACGGAPAGTGTPTDTGQSTVPTFIQPTTSPNSAPATPVPTTAPATPVPTSPGPGKPTDGLTSWWSGDGTAADGTGSAPGMPQNGAAFGPGVFGDAFLFDGQDDYVQLPDSVLEYPTSDPFTFETWFSTTSGGVIFSQTGLRPFDAISGANGAIPAIYVGTDHQVYAQLYWDGSVDPLIATSKVNDGRFHHVAATFDGATERLYLDGALVDQRAIQQLGYGTGTYHYQFGTGFTGTQWPAAPTDTGGWYSFAGLIDEAALYARALSDAEVHALYLAGGGS